MFSVDAVDLFFIAALDDTQILASTSFSGIVLFFTISVSIGFSIVTGTMCAKAIGAGQHELAKKIITTSALIAFVLGLAIAALVYAALPLALDLLKAEGAIKDYALLYLGIIIPSFPLLSVSMALGAVLRSYGDGKRAMNTILVASLVNAVFDPIFIFWFDWGLAGAAWASVLARVASLAASLWPILRYYGGFCAVDRTSLISLSAEFLSRSPNAILQNVATPLGMAAITALLAGYGAEVMAGNTVIARIFPIIFAVSYGLSGAIASIVGQNYGAQRFDRVREAMYASYLFLFVYSLFASLIVLLLTPWFVQIFNLEGQAIFIMNIVAWGFSFIGFFNGVLFVTNGIFNSLGHSRYSAGLNWARHVFIMLPLLYLCNWLFGLVGIFAAQMINAVLIALLSYIIALRLIDHVEHCSQAERDQHKPPVFRWYLPRSAAVIRRNG